MNRLQTRGIILSRTDYGEADRIITVLTPDEGKLRHEVFGRGRAVRLVIGINPVAEGFARGIEHHRHIIALVAFHQL